MFVCLPLLEAATDALDELRLQVCKGEGGCGCMYAYMYIYPLAYPPTPKRTPSPPPITIHHHPPITAGALCHLPLPPRRRGV